MEYLKSYNITDEELLLLKSSLSLTIQNQISLAKGEIVKVLEYLKSLGISNIFNLILYRSDLLFCDMESLNKKFNKFDVNLVKFIIENDPQNLINFDI